MKMKLLCFFNFVVLTKLIIHCKSETINDLDDVNITPGEMQALKRLKDNVVEELKMGYMKENFYLLNWLRANNLNVKETAKKIHLMLKWREDEQIDDILNQDFGDFENDWPYTNDAHDNIGRPVSAADISEWDVRKIFIGGKFDKAIRFLYKNAELGIVKVVEAHKHNSNVTSQIVLVNLNGFNVKQHACPQCLPLYRNLIGLLPNYFPNLVYKLIAINTPITFYPILHGLVGPKMIREASKYVRFYGVNRKQWEPVILSLIPADQILPQFGGTKNFTDY